MALQLILPKNRENTPHPLACQFRVDPGTTYEQAKAMVPTVAEQFVRDMKARGFEYVYGSKWKLSSIPRVPVTPTTIRIPRQLSARQMEPYVRNGARFLDQGSNVATLVRPLHEYDSWEYRLTGMFYKPQILTEVPDAHEEER